MCAKKVDLKHGGEKRKGSALSKYLKIDAMQRNVFIAVCLVSIVLSLTIVGSIRMVKYIAFNGKVLTEKQGIANGYKQIQSDLKTLRTDVADLVKDENLESVARFRGDECYNKANKEVDNESYSVEDIELARTCSALRVVPDAMPSNDNELATLSNMNQLLYWANYGNSVEFEFSGGGSGGSSSGDSSTGGSSLHSTAVSVTLNDTGKNVQGALKEIEDSVRNFDITSASLSWDSDDFWTGKEFDNLELEFSGTFNAYYSDEVELVSQSRTVCANSKSDVCRSNGGDSKGDKYGQSGSATSSMSSTMYGGAE